MFRDAKIETFDRLNLQRFHSSGARAPWERDDYSLIRLADRRYHPQFLRSETGGILGKANEKRRTSIRCWSRHRPVALSLRAATTKPPCIDPATPTQTVTPTMDDPVYYRSLPSRVLQKFLDAMHDVLSRSPLPSLSVGFLDHPNLIDCGQKRLRTGCVRPSAPRRKQLERDGLLDVDVGRDASSIDSAEKSSKRWMMSV